MKPGGSGASVTANRKRLNLENVESNVSEAIEELETIRNRASSGELNEADQKPHLQMPCVPP